MSEKANASCDIGVPADKFGPMSTLHAQYQVHTAEHLCVNGRTAMRTEIDVESLGNSQAGRVGRVSLASE
jgi:hypothetical protein